jgi:hypothetical protein
MRTTVNLDPDVAAEVERLRRDQGVGVSQAVNDLARSGMRARPDFVYVHPRRDLGLSVDISNVAEVLELLDGEG